MRLTPINKSLPEIPIGLRKEPTFGHGEEPFWKSDYSTKDKLIVAGTTALGVAGSLATMAKFQGHKLEPKSFLKYLKNANFLFKE